MTRLVPPPRAALRYPLPVCCTPAPAPAPALSAARRCSLQMSQNKKMMVKRLVCVEYPGRVENVDRMMSTLGGLQTLESIYSRPSARLEVRFRPEDVYSHGVFGDRVPVNNLLVKFRRRRKRTDEGHFEYSLDAEVVGIIETCYRFKSLVDFQYLTMERIRDPEEASHRYRSITEQLISRNPFSEFDKTFDPKAPLLVSPTIFSRFDSASDYYFRDSPKHRDPTMSLEMERQKRLEIIGRNRKSRSIVACLRNWREETPNEPDSPVVFDNAKVNYVSDKLTEEVKKCFEQRPVWSRNALVYKLKCSRVDMKYILPCVAYHFTNGPFRCLWIRFGYDPRQDKASKKYQTLDFRVKQAYAKSLSSERILAKRSIYQYQLPLQKNDSEKNRNRYRASTIQQDALLPSTSQAQSLSLQKTQDAAEKVLASCVFRTGLMPAYRQLFYQLCDIQVDHIQKLIAADDDNDVKECTEKDGWCSLGLIEHIRSLMSSMVDEMLVTSKGTEVVAAEDEADDEEFDEEYLEYNC